MDFDKENTENETKLYSNGDKEEIQVKPKRRVWKSIGKGLLLVLECIGYLFYALFFIWLFVDITDKLKKK